MTQSFTLREPDSEFAQAVFTSPNMMPPWKQQSDVAFNLLQSSDMQLEKPGQKRRRSFLPTGTQDQFNVYNENNLPHERVSNDSVQLSGLEPYPDGSNNMFGGGLDAAQSFPIERRGYYSRVLDNNSSSCGIFPFRAPEVTVEHSSVNSPTASVFLGRNSSDFFNPHANTNQYRNHPRSLDSAAAATAQAMANFQLLIEQGRSNSGFQAYNGSNATQGSATSTLPNRQIPSFDTPLGGQQQLHSNHGFSVNSSFGLPTPPSASNRGFSAVNSSFGLPTPPSSNHGFSALNSSFVLPTPPSSNYELSVGNSSFGLPTPPTSNHGLSAVNSSFGLPTPPSSAFNYFSMGSGGNQSAFQDLNSSVPHAFGDATATATVNGANGIYGANSDTTWPNLTCQTSVRNASQSTLFADPPSPCTPRGNRVTAVLSDAQEECLQHMERINSEPPLSADTPHHNSRGRHISYDSPPPERSSRGNFNLFHPFELDNLGSNSQGQKHFHVYFDESGIPQHVEVEDSAPATTQVDECAVSGTRGNGLFSGAPEETQEENFSQSFEPPVAIAGEKENRNIADQFDLNEVPFAAGEATPPKPRKKYHPRVAKDKRTYKRRVDGKKVPTNPVDGFTNKETPAKKSAKKRPNQTTQYDSTHEEGRDSSYPEVVDMDIEDTIGVTLHTTTQHDTAVCDCEACIKLRLERRNSSAGRNSSSRFASCFDAMPQSPVSPPERHSRGDPWSHNSPDSSSNSPSVRRTLFQTSAPPESDQTSNEAPTAARRLPLAFDSTPEPSNAMVLSPSNVGSFFREPSSCLQQFNESATQLGFSCYERRQQQQQQMHGDLAAKPAYDWNPTFATHRTASNSTNSTFMSRLCPRGILSPQKIPFRDMNQIQRVLYLKSILTSNLQLTMSPESLLRHVYDHLPEGEKEEFKTSLWPIILKPLTDEQMKQLEDYANAEHVVVEAAPMVVARRKPGPKPKKATKKELAMTLWPDLVVQDGAQKAKPGKPGRKSKINSSNGVVDSSQNGLEMVPYENGDKSMVPYENGDKSMVPYDNNKSVVPYENNKSVVPYDGPFNPLRKRKPRPKVVLDDETVRVWKLLMGKTTSDSAENVTDAQNELKWEEERRKMKAQAQLFIDRMHIVQGDRSFSCWKGSVVDSVVGAFLTQNVNDVLSSSAFMSMRSRFPGRGFRRSPLQTQNQESNETVAQSFDTPSPPAPSPTVQNPQTSTPQQPSPQNNALAFPPSSNVTVLESQESRNEENYHVETPAITTQITKPPVHTAWPNHEESASTISSEVINQPDLDLARSGQLSEQTKTVSNSQSENSSGLEYQMVPEELSSGVNNQVDTVVSSEITRELSTEGSAALMEGNHDSSHGKYNPKTGLTGLERAKIEEKQVTARKSFDFSGLQEEFKPRLAGEERPPAPPRTELTEDGVDWEAVRSANVQEVADVIKERGLNWILAGRIKAFLERIHLDYGALDLEWLRSMSTDQTKEFLLSIRGLGLKSVECIRLLTLHHLAFPVDTNVGRICVRLGWVPLEPLPEELQLHLLELYPVQATIQKYLWPRLCKLDQQTLYELHYQMITFGKVFCTKSKPNCNACPMRPECKHFASALSSAKLALPAAERPNNGPTLALPPGTTTTSAGAGAVAEQNPAQDRAPEPPRPVSQYCQPIVEEPMTPESEADMEDFDIEDYPFTVEEVEDDTDMNICIQGQSSTDPQQLVQQSESINNPNCCSILSITDTYVTISEPEPVSEPISKLASEPVSRPVSEVILAPVSEIILAPVSERVQTIMEDWGGLATAGSNSVQLRNVDNGEQSGGSCPESVIKIVESVCEEVVDLESNVDNPSSEVFIHPNTASSHEMVLVAPGAASLPVPKLKNVGRLRTVHYVYELPDNHPLLDGLDPREHDDPCTYLLAIWSPGEVPESIPNMNDTVHEENPFASSSSEGEESIKATLLVPCRTAMQGSFPLNGTYFQVNEVFADHASSLQPLIVPRTLLWNLRRRFVFFGTSVTSIFRGMTVEEIQACFWRGYVCVRGFDRTTRAPKPLVGRLHLQAGKSSGRGANAES